MFEKIIILLPIKLIYLWNIDNNNKSIVIYLIFIIAIFVIGYRNHLSTLSVCTSPISCLFACLRVCASTMLRSGVCMIFLRVYLFARICVRTSMSMRLDPPIHIHVQINCSLFMHGECLLFVSIFHLFVVQIVKYLPFCSVRFFLFIFVSIWKISKHCAFFVSFISFAFSFMFSLSAAVVLSIAGCLLLLLFLLVCVCAFFLLSTVGYRFLAHRFLLFHYLCSFIACK